MHYKQSPALTCSPWRHFADELSLQRGQQSKGYVCLLHRMGLLKPTKTTFASI